MLSQKNMAETGTETGIEAEVVAVVAVMIPTVQTLGRVHAVAVAVAAEIRKNNCSKPPELH